VFAAARHQHQVAGLERQRTFEVGAVHVEPGADGDVEADAALAGEAERPVGGQGANVEQAALQAGLAEHVGEQIHGNVRPR
jgi:hypothetical protein